jgi:Uma2 family endonuclease
VLAEPELHLGPEPDILVPVIAAWREERFPGDVDDDAPFITTAPDWICEILSESTARVDRMQKIPIYARDEVEHLWIVDPRDRTVEVFRLHGGRYVLIGTSGGEEDPFVLEPFGAVPIPPFCFWGRRRSKSR